MTGDFPPSPSVTARRAGGVPYTVLTARMSVRLVERTRYPWPSQVRLSCLNPVWFTYRGR